MRIWSVVVIGLTAIGGLAQKQQQPWASQFVAVSGPTLLARQSNALLLANTSRFWFAYQVPVKPNIAIDTRDINVRWDPEIHGPDVSVNVNSSTPDLGVFVHYDRGRLIREVQVFNLQRQHSMDDPVYWAGEVTAVESLAFLRDVLNERPDLGIGLVRAVGIHEARETAAILKDSWSKLPVEDHAREEALCWIGQTQGETAFLESLVKDRGRPLRDRSAALFALLESADKDSVQALNRLKLDLAEPPLQRMIFGYKRPLDSAQALRK